MESRVSGPCVVLHLTKRELPSGAVTFLFTDIEGSTALWEQHPSEMPAALARHDQLVTAAITSHHGVVFKTLGDGICAAFSSAFHAVGAALDAQRSLTAEAWKRTGPLRIRVALHTGLARPQAGDYLGPPLNRVARLLATAHGGQVVLSQAAAHLVQDELPDGASLTDLGEHRLRDLSRPEHVFQLDHPDLPGQFPPLRSLGSYRHNLPHRLTEFIGRQREIESTTGLLRNHRLVTLVGTGGVGKTSLAIRTAAESIELFPGGIWLVDLAPVPRPELVGGAVAAVLGVREVPREATTQTLTRHLPAAETLLVMDNCEHVIDGAAPFIAALLEGTPRVRVLATSREPLAILGEAVLTVPPLRTPASTDLPRAEIETTEAVTLFTDRARLLQPDFTLDDDNAGAVAEICCRLDGIPLAIELAAARITTATPSQIAERLDDRFRLLTKGSRTAPDRHQTLEALVDWSHELLAKPEQVLFRRLAVFGGGFPVEAVEQVCGFDPIDRESVADLLDRLADTSMVIPPRPTRYRMFETTRHYARCRLDSAGETDQTMRRLASYVLDAGPESADGFIAGDALEWHAWRDQEQDDFRAVLSWAIATGDKDIATRTFIEFLNWLSSQGCEVEIRSWTEALLPLLGEERTRRRARLLTVAASNELERGETARAHVLIEQLRDTAEAIGDLGASGMANLFAAQIAYKAGDFDRALDMNGRAADLFERAGDRRHLNTTYGVFFVQLARGRYDEAEELADELVAFNAQSRTAMDASFIEHEAAWAKALVALHRGDYEEVSRLLSPRLAYAVDLGSLDHAECLLLLGLAALGSGDHTAAGAYAEEATAEVTESAPFDLLRRVRSLQALVALETADTCDAASHLDAALTYAERYEAIIEIYDVVASTGDLALAADDALEATVLHAAATAGRRRVGVVLGAWHRERFARTMVTLRDTLGSEQFEQLWDGSSRLTIDDSVVRARRFILTVLDRPHTTQRPAI